MAIDASVRQVLADVAFARRLANVMKAAVPVGRTDHADDAEIRVKRRLDLRDRFGIDRLAVRGRDIGKVGIRILRRGSTVEAVREDADPAMVANETATNTLVTLTDDKPPADRAFYVIRVTP